jgi:(4S)-4-hydroxy-5-phosphonooxypentane-2,3-dione isomerase
MLVLVVHWEANPGSEAEVVETFSKLAAESRKEPGCRQYVAHQHRENARQFLVYEVYDNEAALQAHRDSAHFKQYAVGDLPRLGNRLQADLYNPLN